MKYMKKRDASMAREKKTTLIEEEMDRIFAEKKTVTPALMVEAAMNADSPLHRYFEWNDGLAATKYRLAQATQMIMATKYVCVLEEQRDVVPRIVHAEQEHTAHLVRKFLPAHGSGEGFVPRPTVLADAEMRAALVDRKKGALRSWCRGVIDISELDPIRVAIEGALSP